MTEIRRVSLSGLVVVVSSVSFCGCGPERPAMGRVNGVVTHGGKPLAAANVMFVPVQGGRPATATTDEQGRFTLTTYTKNDGALVGEHNVAIVKLDSPAVGDAGPHNGPIIPAVPGMPQSTPPRASQIPTRYGKAATSGLSATIVPGDNHPTFDLTP